MVLTGKITAPSITNTGTALNSKNKKFNWYPTVNKILVKGKIMAPMHKFNRNFTLKNWLLYLSGMCADSIASPMGICPNTKAIPNSIINNKVKSSVCAAK